jgi:hypothetical protein
MSDTLIRNAAGGYRFLPGIAPYSSGVISDNGHEIVHATLRRSLPWREGFAWIEQYLRAQGRDRAALCAVELRSPAPFTRQGFLDFNTGYCALLEEWGLLVEGRNPVARTNVAPQYAAPEAPSLYGFSYTVPILRPEGRTFIVAGAGEMRGGPMLEAQVIRAGETTPDAMREKADYVMSVMSKRLAGLGVGWEQVTATSIYTAQPLDPFIGPAVLEPLGPTAVHGLRWYPSRPPIADLDYEMDTRGVRQEHWL